MIFHLLISIYEQMVRNCFCNFCLIVNERSQLNSLVEKIKSFIIMLQK